LIARAYAGQLAGDPAFPVRMLYLGAAASAAEFENFVGADAVRDAPPSSELFRGTLASYPMWRAATELAGASFDVAVCEDVPLLPGRPDDVLHYPFLDAHLVVRASLDEQIRRVRSRSYRKLLRAMRKRAGRRWTARRDREALALFWSRFHEPYVRSRFGKRAVIDSEASLAQLFDRCGTVLLLEMDGAPVAATVVLRDFVVPGELTYHRNGFLASSPDLLTEHTAALELSLFEYALECGSRTIDLGFTRGIVNDGRFVHKRRLGCTFHPTAGSARYRIACTERLRPPFFSRFSILAGAPDAFELHLGYEGGHDGGDVQKWRGQLKNYMLPGLQKVRLHLAAAARGGGFERALREVVGDREVVVD
jgi:hypothetical protein